MNSKMQKRIVSFVIREQQIKIIMFPIHYIEKYQESVSKSINVNVRKWPYLPRLLESTPGKYSGMHSSTQ